MNGAENLRAVLDGGKAEYTPCYFGNVSVMTSSAIHNKPQTGSKGGKDWWGVEWVLDDVNQSFSPAVGVEPVLKDVVNWKNELVFPQIDDIDWEDDGSMPPHPGEDPRQLALF